jgi:hypothetical protein
VALLPLAFAVAAAILTLSVSRSVALYGDDFYYLAIPFTGVRDFFAAHAHNYVYDNGRFIVHVLASLFLRGDAWLWRLLLPIEIGAIVFLICRLSEFGSSRAGVLRCAIALSGVLLVGINVGREGVYWVTGSFNYIYPTLLTLVYFHLISKRGEYNKHSALVPIFGFLAAASVEQAAVIAVVITAVDAWKRRRAGRDLDKTTLAAILAVAVGAASVILAPGQFNRLLDIGASYGTPLLATIRQNTHFLILDVLLSEHLRVYFVLLAAALSAFAFSRSRRRLFAALFSVAAFGMAAATYFCQRKFVTPYILAILMFFAVSAFAAAVVSGNTVALTAILAAIASLAFMLPSPVVGFRSVLFFLIYIAVFAAAIIPELPAAVGIPASVVLTAAAAYAVLSIAPGYAENAVIHAQNRERVIAWHASDTDGELVQIKPKNELYGWSMPYNADFHRIYYNRYCGVPRGREITWLSPER